MKGLRELLQGLIGKSDPAEEKLPEVPQLKPKGTESPPPTYPLKTWDATRNELIRLKLIGLFERHMASYESRTRPHPDWYLVLKGGYVFYFHPKWSEEAEHWIKSHGVELSDTVFHSFTPPTDE